MTLPFAMSPAACVFMAGAFLLASFVRGYSGFGFSALVVAAASLVTHPLNFVAVVMVCEFLMTFLQWTEMRRDASWWRVAALMAGALVGVPLGLWVLTSVSVDITRSVISAFVIGMCLMLLSGRNLPAESGRISHAGVGLASGMANAAGMGGLPVAAFFAAQPIPVRVFRATLIAYFPILDMWTLPNLWRHELLSWDTIVVTAAAAPLMVVGIWAGGRRFLAASPTTFRRFAVMLLMVLASLGLLKAVL